MKMTRIRKLASALTLALVAFVVSGGDLAGPFFETVGGITWTYSVRDGMAVLGYRPSVKRAVDTTTVGDLTIPASLRGYPVREIGEFAFHSCMSLTSVTIPEGVTTLAPYSFTWCGVSTLDLPKSASYVTGEAFGTCGRSSKEYAMSVTVAEGNAHYKAVDGFLLTKDGTELVFSPLLKTRVVLPNTVKRIGIQAFCNHIRLEEVVVPASVETIGASAFIDCANLQKIVFGGNAPKIGASAFRNITATGYVGYGSTGWGTVPGTWNGISLVYGQDDGTYQETVDGLEWIYYVVQGGVELRSVRFGNMVGAVEIPGSLGGRPVTANGADAFAGCALLKSVTIPSIVTYIGPHAFDDCTALTKIAFAGAIPAGVADSGLLAQAVEVSCKRADVRTVQELASDGCNVYIWTTNGQRMKVMGNPPLTEGEPESVAVVMEVRSTGDRGEGALREALAVTQDGDMILFNLDESAEIVLSTPLVVTGDRFASKGLTIGGVNGGRCVTLKGNNTFQLLTVQAGNKVNIDGVTFKNGKSSTGGAIGNYGAITVRNCSFVNNESPSLGGAICNMRAMSCYVQNCDFVGNACGAWGGAIASHTTPLTTLLHCRFADNTCEAWGGAIAAFSTGDALVIDCKVNGNEAYGGGGAVAQSGARITIIGSDISGNSATAGRGNDLFNLGGTMNAIGSYCQDNYGSISGTTDLPEIPKKCSSLLCTDTKALGSWYSKVVDASGCACMRLNAQACPRFAPPTGSKPTFEVTDEAYVTMKVENVKPLLYYGLGWSETPDGEFVVEPGMWVRSDANGVLPSDVKAPKGVGASRFFRVKVTDDPTVAK